MVVSKTAQVIRKLERPYFKLLSNTATAEAKSIMLKSLWPRSGSWRAATVLSKWRTSPKFPPQYCITVRASSSEDGDTRHSLVQSPYGALLDNARKSRQGEPRERFAVALLNYMEQEKFRRGHVKFITFALQQMDEFGLEKDLLTYNRLIDIFPRNRFKPMNMFDAFWPKPLPQIEIALEILQKMEDNGVRPDYTTYDLLKEIFGRVSFPVQKCVRIAYWFDKFENVDPYWIEGELPGDPFEVSKLALLRIAGSDGTITDLKVL